MIEKNQMWILENPVLPTCEPDSRGIGAHVFDVLSKNGDSIAQIDAHTGKQRTYRDLLEDTVSVAEEMTARGIKSGDIISVCAYNHLNTNTPIIAATYLLVKTASIDPEYEQDEKTQLLKLIKPRMIFVDEEALESVELALKSIGIQTDIVVFGKTDKYISYEEFLNHRGHSSSFIPKHVEDLFDTAFIFFSSGTTGLPKGICLHHYGILYVTNVYSQTLELKSLLPYTRPTWISHILNILVIYNLGACQLVCKTFDEKTVFEIIDKYDVQYTFLAPVYTHHLTSNPSRHKYDTSKLYGFGTGGNTLSVTQLNALQNVFPNALIMFSYGCTETSGAITTFQDTEMLIPKRGSSGTLFPGITCKIVDPETNKILGPNQQGEMLVKSKCLMKCYYNNPEETKKCFDEEGFFRTGDLVYFDDDKYFYVVDRIKETFKYRTWPIAPSQLESVLVKHPAVKEAIVLGIPHPEDDQRPMALIVLKENMTATETEIMNFFDERINSDKKKLRAGIRFVKNIPKTPTGKYLRRVIKNQIINEKNFIA